MSSKLEYLQDALKFCFLPELRQDLDDFPIQSDHFKEYREVLEVQLQQLFDVIQQNAWIWESKEPDVFQIHASLLLLFCEITAPEAVYALENDRVLQNAEKLLQRQIHKVTAQLDVEIFSYYKDKLKTNCWKRHLGAVHGFIRFLQLRYTSSKSHGASCVMSNDWLTFCLSVGLNFGECHDPVYKHFSTQIFTVMLCSAQRADILTLNIHSVIHSAVFKNIHKLNSVAETTAVWNCLLLCLDFYDDMESLSWSLVDDMMEALMRCITLASDALVCICLLKFVAKLCAYFSFNRNEIEKKLDLSLNSTEALTECRYTCADNNSYTPFRWAKRIIEIFSSEAYKLMAGGTICRQMLIQMHRCYMVCILPVPLQVSHYLLIPFWSKFIATLMEVLAIEKNDQEIVRLVRSVLETFQHQLKFSPFCEGNPDLQNYQKSIEQLLTESIFRK